MEKDNKPLKQSVIVERPIEKDGNFNEQKSFQDNCQDLDQEQNVNANPFQFNSQNFQIVISDNKNNYSGKITGITYSEKDNHILSNVIILLYFGHDTELSVCRTNSDKNGKFVIDNIPPGYYTLKAYIGEEFIYSSHYIKILPGDSIEHPIFLKNYNKEETTEKETTYDNHYHYYY